MRFYRVCGHTSHILQLEERPWSVSTAIVAVREPSRTGNRGAAAPIFWPGRRCLPELAEGDRKVGCRRPTFLKFAKRRQIIWFFPTWQSCIFRRSRTDECPTPRHENAQGRTHTQLSRLVWPCPGLCLVYGGMGYASVLGQQLCFAVPMYAFCHHREEVIA